MTTRYDSPKQIRRCAGVIAGLGVTVLAVCGTTYGDVKVALVRSWGQVSVFEELNLNWHSYGDIPLTIDTSLMEVSSFTYEDLEATGADVLWISDPSGGTQQYSTAEIEAVKNYLTGGHSILGTYLTFQYSDVDNRGLAPIFGLPQTIDYSYGEASGRFDIIVDHPIFRGVPDPYVSSGYEFAQVPADGLIWDAEDLGVAELLAQTDDKRGVITWYLTPSHHAIFVSQMVEYEGNPTDTQFLYNALTIPEPTTVLLLGVGVFALQRKSRTKRWPRTG